MPSTTYILFRNAILAEQQVTCIYDGRPRELCPHIIGTNKTARKLRRRGSPAAKAAASCRNGAA